MLITNIHFNQRKGIVELNFPQVQTEGNYQMLLSFFFFLVFFSICLSTYLPTYLSIICNLSTYLFTYFNSEWIKENLLHRYCPSLPWSSHSPLPRSHPSPESAETNTANFLCSITPQWA